MSKSNTVEHKPYENSIDTDIKDINLRVLCKLYYIKQDRDNTIGCNMCVTDIDVLYFYPIYDTIRTCCLGLYIIKELKEYYNYIFTKKDSTADILTSIIKYIDNKNDEKREFKIIFKDSNNITQIKFFIKITALLMDITYLKLITELIKDVFNLVIKDLNTIKNIKNSTITYNDNDIKKIQCMAYYYYPIESLIKNKVKCICSVKCDKCYNVITGEYKRKIQSLYNLRKANSYDEYSEELLDKLFSALSNIPNYITVKTNKEIVELKYKKILPNGSISDFK